MANADSGGSGLRIGFIGLGRMGSPVAANIAKAGFQLGVYNRTPAKAEALAREVGTTAGAATLSFTQDNELGWGSRAPRHQLARRCNRIAHLPR